MRSARSAYYLVRSLGAVCVANGLNAARKAPRIRECFPEYRLVGIDIQQRDPTLVRPCCRGKGARVQPSSADLADASANVGIGDCGIEEAAPVVQAPMIDMSRDGKRGVKGGEISWRTHSATVGQTGLGDTTKSGSLGVSGTPSWKLRRNAAILSVAGERGMPVCRRATFEGTAAPTVGDLVPWLL